MTTTLQGSPPRTGGGAADVLVVGGGFRGMAAAWFLAARGDAVTLIDRADRLGGVLAGIERQGRVYDLGCHLFDNTTRAGTRFLIGLAGGADRFRGVDVAYASALGQGVSAGMAVPDLSALPEPERAGVVQDFLIAQAGAAEGADDLAAAILATYGRGAAPILTGIARKIFAEDPAQLSAAVLDQGLLSRIRLLDDRTSLFLKRHPALDRRLAVPAGAIRDRLMADADPDWPRNLYPAAGGTRGFVEAARDSLVGAGVRLDLGCSGAETLAAIRRRTPGHVFCALPADQAETLLLGTTRLAAALHAVPMVLFYVEVARDDLGGVDYLHDFAPERLTFRVSTPGRFGTEARTHVCVECPTPVGSPLWQDPEAMRARVWQEVAGHGFVRPGTAPGAGFHIRASRTYSLPRPGFAALRRQVLSEIATAFPGLRMLDSAAIAKSAIHAELQDFFAVAD